MDCIFKFEVLSLKDLIIFELWVNVVVDFSIVKVFLFISWDKCFYL